MDKPVSQGGLRSFSGIQQLGLVVVVLVIGTYLSYLGYTHSTPGQPNLFLNKYNLMDGVATPMSIYAIMAVGMTCVIITGGIDISVGSVMGFAALAGASALEHLPADAPWWQVLPIGFGVPVIVGALCGLFNGAFVVGLGLHSFIVTLGSMGIFRCLAIVLPKEPTLPSSGKSLPQAFTPDIMRWSIADVEVVPLLTTIIVVACGVVFLRFMIAGREAFAVGGNEQAARFSGIRVGRAKLRVYVISGACAGIAAFVSLGRFGTASSNSATGYELSVVAAAVIGGASLSGGRGTAIGALLGTLVIALIENGIQNFSSNQGLRLGIVGASIIIAVTVEQFLRRHKTA